jgi:hypothetical protein
VREPSKRHQHSICLSNHVRTAQLKPIFEKKKKKKKKRQSFGESSAIRYLREMESNPAILYRWDRRTNCNTKRKATNTQFSAQTNKEYGEDSLCAPIDWHSVFGIEEIRCGRVVDDYNVLQRSTQLAQIFHVISSMTNYAHIANDILLSND